MNVGSCLTCIPPMMIILLQVVTLVWWAVVVVPRMAVRWLWVTTMR